MAWNVVDTWLRKPLGHGNGRLGAGMGKLGENASGQVWLQWYELAMITSTCVLYFVQLEMVFRVGSSLLDSLPRILPFESY